MKLEHFGLHSRDPEALATWYCEKLGFRVVRTLEKDGRPPIFFLSTDEGAQVEILPSQAGHASRTLEQGGFSHIGLVVGDFDALERDLASKSVSLIGVRDTSNDWRIGYCKDPELNVIEFVARPGSTPSA